MINKKEVIGNWEMEKRILTDEELIHLDINEDGTLTYTILNNGAKQIILLTYKLEGDFLITDQPSAPDIQKTQVTLLDNKLIFNYNGEISVFQRRNSNPTSV